MYFSVYLFKNKPTGPHEVDFVIGNRRDLNYTISCPKRERVIREEGGLITKTDFQTGGLLERGWGLLERGA